MEGGRGVNSDGRKYLTKGYWTNTKPHGGGGGGGGGKYVGKGGQLQDVVLVVEILKAVFSLRRCR